MTPTPNGFAHADLLRRAVIIFIPLALVAASVIYLLFRLQSTQAHSTLLASEQKIVEAGRQYGEAELAVAFADTRFLARQRNLHRWLTIGDPAVLGELAEDYISFQVVKSVYDQIRFLDFQGREVVRVDWNNGRPVRLSDDQLQTKVTRYYVPGALALQAGGVYVSPFDLNFEHGTIEHPIKPVIRFASPVVDGSGKPQGLVVVNYLGQSLLDHIRELGDLGSGRVRMLNTDGYWLIGPTAADEWAFMDPDRQDHSFASRHPDIWTRIQGGPPVGQFDADGDLLTYAKIGPIGQTPDRSMATSPAAIRETGDPAAYAWIMLTRVPRQILADRQFSLILRYASAYGALVILLAGVAFAIAGNRQRQRQAERLMRASEARFRSMLEAAPDAVVITDPEGRIVLVNAETQRLFGHERDRLIGEPVEILLPERFRHRHADHRAGYASDPQLRSMGVGLELQGLRSDGGEVPVEISLSPVETDEGLRIVAAIRDVTEWRASQREIRDLNRRLTQDNAQLAALNAELEAFSYAVSHDLRAPLRAIDGFSQALLEDCADDLGEQGLNDLSRVRNAAQRMGQLIDDLLALSRITRGDLNVETVDLGPIALEIIGSLQANDPDRRADVEIADGLSVSGDRRLLRIAMENLLGNAWKFTGERDSALIRFGKTDHDGTAALFVSDNGAGFDMTYADQLFRPFERLHGVHEFPGTGIGLATVQRVIHKHGGRIWAEARAGEGATFYIAL